MFVVHIGFSLLLNRTKSTENPFLKKSWCFVDQLRGFTWRGKSVVSRRKQSSGRMAEHFYWSFITAFVLES